MYVLSIFKSKAVFQIFTNKKKNILQLSFLLISFLVIPKQ